MAGTRTTRVKFLGSYLNQLDGKGRVSLPAAFRREAADQGFVLIQAHAPSLTLYPEGAWTEVEERLRDLLRHQPEARMWVLRMMSNAVEVIPDAQGRILVPARLKEAVEADGAKTVYSHDENGRVRTAVIHIRSPRARSWAWHCPGRSRSRSWIVC